MTKQSIVKQQKRETRRNNQALVIYLRFFRDYQQLNMKETVKISLCNSLTLPIKKPRSKRCFHGLPKVTQLGPDTESSDSLQHAFIKTSSPASHTTQPPSPVHVCVYSGRRTIKHISHVPYVDLPIEILNICVVQ